MKRNIYADALIRVLIIFVLSFLVCGIITALCSCARKIYVPVESTVTHTDTCYNAQIRVDSVLLRDSVAVMQHGDTVRITRWRDRYRVKQRTDTVYRTATDSVRVEVPYPVERELTRWERTKQDIGGIALGAVIAMTLAALIIWIAKSRRKK